MYFYPHWEKYLKNCNDWKKILNKFLTLHPSLLDTNKMKGGDQLYTLGKKKNKKIKINKKLFKKKVLHYLVEEDINSRNFLLAIHLAYASCKNENINKKKILVYHLHICWFFKNLYNDFNSIKTISMVRETKSNLPKRIANGLEKQNKNHLNFTDEFFFRIRSYKNAIFEIFFTLDHLSNFNNSKHRVIKHEDFLVRKKSLIRKVCNFLDIKYEKTLEQSTFSKLVWNFKSSSKIRYKEGVSSHILNYDEKFFFRHELFWLDYLSQPYNKKFNYISLYNYKKNVFYFLLIFFFIFIPSKREFEIAKKYFQLKYLKEYFIKLYQETSTKNIILYEKNAFYFHKWSNKRFPFKLFNFFLRKLKNEKNLFWKLSYFFIKLFEFILMPFFMVMEYIERIIICQIVLTKIFLGKNYLPSKL